MTAAAPPRPATGDRCSGMRGLPAHAPVASFPNPACPKSSRAGSRESGACLESCPAASINQ